MNYVQKFKEALGAEFGRCGLDVDDDLLELYTLLGMMLGVNVRLRDVHEAWAVWRNRTNPQHKSLIPFDDLSKEVQDLDLPYCRVIRDVSSVFYRS
jgi:hypothetical protein